jgi:hypothetical protein
MARSATRQPLETFVNLVLVSDQVNTLYTALWSYIDLLEQVDEESDPVAAEEAVRAREIITALDGTR